MKVLFFCHIELREVRGEDGRAAKVEGVMYLLCAVSSDTRLIFKVIDCKDVQSISAIISSDIVSNRIYEGAAAYDDTGQFKPISSDF